MTQSEGHALAVRLGERAVMKQRFLNQKLGKRMSRKADLQKAKARVFPPQRKGKQRVPPAHPTESLRGGDE